MTGLRRDQLRRATDRLRVGRRLRHATDLAARSWHYVLHIGSRTAELEGRVDHLERLATIRTAMAWIAEATVPDDVLVSVVMATRNRSSLAARALRSVEAQVHPAWEVVLVDDGSDDEHAAALRSLAEHERVRLVRSPRRGVAAARNVGLEHATGELVVYLDDDNHLHPLWTKAVVWAFDQRPEVDVAVGARLIDDAERVRGRPSGGAPEIQYERIDPKVLERRPQTDIGCLAHRRRIATRFDERFAGPDDWDWLRRALADHEFVEVPCLAVTYTTDAPGRSSRPLSGADERG